jgi:hypothetical protein
VTVPDWLTTRHGNLTRGLNDDTWFVTLNGHPFYRLIARPAKGVFSCAIMQTNNGHRLDEGKTYPNRDSALTGGLDELRNKLGW